ncbi:MAG: porphobilinogen synthase, partial [Alphaproteobacteria bacterium]|nr:porphobilinogen synthase [Alphaproteobacteria bacterium]
MSRSFPQTRLRRNRTDSWLRELLKEHYLTVNDLVLPLFVQEGEKQKTAIKALPDIYRLSIDLLLAEIKLAIKYGIKAIALFPVIEEKFKTIDAREAYNHNNLICRAIKAIKAEYQDQIGIIADVALDPYNQLGHDGLVKNGKVLNDETIKILAKQALTLATAGADIIAPSDM